MRGRWSRRASSSQPSIATRASAASRWRSRRRSTAPPARPTGARGTAIRRTRRPRAIRTTWRWSCSTTPVTGITPARLPAADSLSNLPNDQQFTPVGYGAGDGGTCYGDSGGPNFLGAGASETNIIAGTTVTGDTPCRATNVDYRLDTPSARSFLGQFVTLP